MRSGLGEQEEIVVEGFFDCINVSQSFNPSVAAMMGLSPSERQEHLLLSSSLTTITMRPAQISSMTSEIEESDLADVKDIQVDGMSTTGACTLWAYAVEAGFRHSLLLRPLIHAY